MKKFISLTLTALLAANMGVTAFAADGVANAAQETFFTVSARDYTYAEEIANKLKSIGLFKGVSDTDFDLDRAPTRTEAVVMLIRFLGKEAEALEGKHSHPFTDVPEWANAYVGYAYENKLTNGISATEFGATSDASAAMFLTFVLRALGYSDANGADFTWDNPYELAEKAGILTDTVNRDQFYRADVAIVAYNALEADMKGTDKALSEMLIENGAFTAEDYAKIAPKTVKKYNYRTDFTDYSPSDGLTEDGYFEGVNLSDYVDFTEYDKMDISSYLTVTDAELNKALADYVDDFEFPQITDRAVVDGDVINVTFMEYIDGVLEEESVVTDDIEINKRFMEDIVRAVESLVELYANDDANIFHGDDPEALKEVLKTFAEVMDMIYGGLIGVKPGESLEITFTDMLDKLAQLGELLGEDVSEFEEYSGKEVVGKITVNYIYDFSKTPEISDEIAKEWGYDTAEELIADAREWLLYDKKNAAFTMLYSSVKVREIPDAIVEYAINSTMYELYLVAEAYGLTLDDMLSAMGEEDVTLSEYVEANIEEFEFGASMVMIGLAIAEHEGITVTEEMMDTPEYIELEELYGDRAAKMMILVITGLELLGYGIM